MHQAGHASAMFGYALDRPHQGVAKSQRAALTKHRIDRLVLNVGMHAVQCGLLWIRRSGHCFEVLLSAHGDNDCGQMFCKGQLIDSRIGAVVARHDFVELFFRNRGQGLIDLSQNVKQRWKLVHELSELFDSKFSICLVHKVSYLERKYRFLEELHESDMIPETKPLNRSSARELIRQLNRIDLDHADYDYIRQQIERLAIGVQFRAVTPHRDARLYRGIVYKHKPTHMHELGCPPAAIVRDFQRCNPPHKPMFYCSPDPASIFFELDVQEGDLLYLSKWSVIKDFWVLQMLPKTPDDVDVHDFPLDIVLSFFETKFSQPIHETYSSQYKITAAISAHLTTGSAVGQHPMGAVSYPSVSHPGRSENLAIKPEIVDAHLKLDYVEELHVDKREGDTFSYSHRDFSAKFEDGMIHWTGKPLHWTIQPGEQLTTTWEGDAWVARNDSGKVVNPG